MNAKWAAVGAETATHLYPGAPHGSLIIGKLSTVKNKLNSPGTSRVGGAWHWMLGREPLV